MLCYYPMIYQRCTNVILKLTPHTEMFQFIESTIKSDISMICKDHAESNNKILKSYDANKPTSFIIYLQANSLHSLHTTQLLQTEYLIGLIKKILIQ